MNRIALAVSLLTLVGCQAYLGRDEGKPSASPTAKGSTSPIPPPVVGAAGETGGAASAGGRAAEAKPVPLTPAPTALPPPPARRIASGTVLRLVLETTAASDKSRPGDLIVAKLAADLKEGDRVLLPAGTEVRGEVLAAEGSGRVKGRARLAVGFMKLVAGGKTYAIQTSAIDATAAAQKGRDAKIIGGGAAAGALIGALAGGGSGAAKGAAIGGAAGGGTVLATKGKEVVFSAGSRHTVTLKTSLILD
jgi:hypothetical protein